MVLSVPLGAGEPGPAAALPRRRLTAASAIGLVLTALVAALLVSPASRAAAAPSGFVSRCGIHFCLNGKSYYFAGANTYDLFTYGGSSGDTETQWMDKTRIDNQMTQLAADHVQVLRTWMFDHESWHGFETAKGVYSEPQFSEFDYILSSAAAHNIRVIPVLENYWEAYGGIDTRLTWEGLGTGQANRWRFFNKAACPGCFTQYKNYVNYALNRTNHYTGVKYKDDPTIFSWELMNEPRYEGQGTDESTNGTTLRAWVDEMGAYIKGLDANHMVDAGLEGHQSKYGFGGDEGNPFVYIQQSPYVDFTSAHPYPTEGWAGLDIPKTQALIDAWISDSHNVVGKPFFMGEWNTNSGDKVAWWTAILNEIQTAGGDGDAFWWYKDGTGGGGYDEVAGLPELAVFRAHSDWMTAKSGGTVTTTTTTTRPVTTTTTSGGTGKTCSAAYAVSGQWTGGFQGAVTVTAGTSAISGWKVTWTFANGQTISQAWSATVTSSGSAVTATNLSWNGALGAGANTSFGFLGSWNGTNSVPTLTCTAS